MNETILLCPRPLARYGGRFVLLPLLSQQQPLKPLPAEIWSRIFTLALSADASPQSPRRFITSRSSWCVSLMLVCKSFRVRSVNRFRPSNPFYVYISFQGAQARHSARLNVFSFSVLMDKLSTSLQKLLTPDSQEVASPLLYSYVKLYTTSGLDKFTLRLRTADQSWDSIRRIPYSTPGRWVQSFDLSEITAVHDSRQALVVDSLLTTLFPLMPFMENLALSSALPLSRRALASLTNRDGSSNLRTLSGVCYIAAFSSTISTEEDPFVRLLRTCHQLERLEVAGSDMEPADAEFDTQEAVNIPVTNAELDLPRLHALTVLSMPSSSLLHALLDAALPRLRVLYITPYDDVPYPRALTTRFLDVHGNSLSTLSLFTPKSWPTRFHPSPGTLLRTCPNLRHLSLESPLPALVSPNTADSMQAVVPLQILSIPRPNYDFWRTLETLLPSLPSLNVVRIRDVRWLRKGLNHYAQEAGVQGEMRVWRQRLAKRGICLVDGDWKDMA